MENQEIINRFILTEYLCPLKEPIRIFGDFYFDNLRNFEEIKLVAKGLQQIVESLEKFAPTGMHVTNELLEIKLNKALSEIVDSSDSISKKYDNKYKDSYRNIASSVVIMRYTSTSLGEIPSFQETSRDDNAKENINYFEEIKKTEIAFEKARNILDFIVFVSFQNSIHPYNYDTIFMYDYFSPFNLKRDVLVKDSIENMLLFPAFKSSDKNEPSDYKQKSFPEIFTSLKPNIELVNTKLKDQTFNYIVDNIAYLKNINNYRIEIVMIVSLLESLVSHKPDVKFNIDNSIRKQFSDKISLIAYLDNKDFDTMCSVKELKLIYDLRSSIAHGNFGEISGILLSLHKHYEKNDQVYSDASKKYIKTYNSEDFWLYHSLNRAKLYLRIILKKFLEDQKLLEIVQQ